MIPKALFVFHLLIGSSLLVKGSSSKTTGPISDSDYPWTYKCVDVTMDGPACQRKEFNSSEDGEQKIPLKVCILTCGPYGALWPYPTGHVSLGSTLANFSSNNIVEGTIDIPENNQVIATMTRTAINILKENVEVKIPQDYESETNSNRVTLNILIRSAQSRINLETNESYTLRISPDENDPSSVVVTISAETFFGARHALESLSQLIEFNIVTNLFQIVNNVDIADTPKFRYRGLSIDTARNFIPIKDLKRLIDGLSYNKMSVLHWHITDSNSYPFYSKRVPQMAVYGTYGAHKIYTPEAVTEFLNYANQRGIKVIPELDAPAHAGNGWQFGEKEGLGELSLCLNFEPYEDYCIQPPCGQLNPLNSNMYNVLGDLYKDLLDVFDKDIFHMGGDEISFDCWLASEEITSWMATHNSTDLMDLWGIFQQTAHQKLKEATTDPVKAIVWTSEMTARARQYIPPEDYVIQIWSKSTDEIVASIYNESYSVILSNNDTVYLDHGYGPWRGTQHNVNRKSWHVLYNHDLIGQIERFSGEEVAKEMYESGRLLGGEACMWSEKVDALNMEGKIWPRTSAYAERLWSNPSENARFAYPRLIHQRETMILRGILPDTLLPEACYHIWGFCDRYD